jgi:acyl-CoA hydrolase
VSSDLASPMSLRPSPTAPVPQGSSLTIMTEHVLPPHANAFGNVFGGQIMAWVDICAAICAGRHTRLPCVTAFVDDLHFVAPVKVGEIVALEARVTATFRTSLEIAVTVTGENPVAGRRWACTNALLTFVAVDGAGKPLPVPPLLLETPELEASQKAGEARRAQRKASGK